MGPMGGFPIENGWRPLLRDVGISERAVLRRAGLPEDLFSRVGASLSTDEYFRFWEALDVEGDDPALSVRIVEAFTAEGFAPPIFASLCSPSLRVAIKRLAHYKRLIAPMALDIDERDGLKVGVNWLEAISPPPASLANMELAFFVRLARMGTREPIKPIGVTSPHVSPELESYLGVRIDRGDQLSVCFSSDDADRPFLTANDSMWSIFEPDLRRRLAELEASATVAERVRAALLELLPSGQASMRDVAERLGMSTRTLQRRLQREDTSYLAILNQTRERLAKHYLAKTALSCAEISFLLGYEEPNSFFRAFHDWTGDSPEQMRKSLAI